MTRLVMCIALCVSLSGCFFVYIPGGAIDSLRDSIHGTEGQHCVAETAKVGDHLTLPEGGLGEVKSLSGISRRCKDPSRPIRAKIDKVIS